MKKILLLIAAVALCYSTQAQGPVFAPYILATFTNLASTATNIGAVMDVRKQANVGIQWTAGSISASTTDTNSIFITYSMDGVTYTPNLETTPGGPTGKRITIALNNTTPVTLTTNIPTLGCGYLKLSFGTNSAATADVTNKVVYAIKTQAP